MTTKPHLIYHRGTLVEALEGSENPGERIFRLHDRIAGMARDPLNIRLLAALCEWAERFGSSTEDGWIRIAVTQRLMANYVGTTREGITVKMGQLYKIRLLRLRKDGQGGYDLDLTNAKKLLEQCSEKRKENSV